MRLQEEEWLAQHIPIRDAVFKEHEETFTLASASSKAALEEIGKCDETRTQYSGMKDNFSSRVEQMNLAHQEKFDKDVIQFCASKRNEKTKDELAKRLKKNGGKALNYFLIPKAYNAKKFNADDDSDDDYYVVPLIFDRLSKSKKRRTSAKAEHTPDTELKQARAKVNSNRRDA